MQTPALDLSGVLEELGKRSIQSVLVEGDHRWQAC
jgi:riboflavin biosynthesis pyrimidine reductase